MTINGISGANSQAGQMRMNQATDSYSKNIQNQIANAQKKLQELSSNEEMSLEEKMKKRQEIQQQISDLNMQLRQHQVEQRREKQQAKGPSMDDMLGGNQKVAKSGNKGSGMSQASMQAMIAADSSMKQAQVQGSVATQMEGKAGVLEAEIKMDSGRGASTERKKEELADLQAKAQAATASQISTLADAGKVMEEAAKEDQETEAVENKKTENDDTNIEGKEAEESASTQADTSASESTHTSIDIRL